MFWMKSVQAVSWATTTSSSSSNRLMQPKIQGGVVKFCAFFCSKYWGWWSCFSVERAWSNTLRQWRWGRRLWNGRHQCSSPWSALCKSCSSSHPRHHLHTWIYSSLTRKKNHASMTFEIMPGTAPWGTGGATWRTAYSTWRQVTWCSTWDFNWLSGPVLRWSMAPRGSYLFTCWGWVAVKVRILDQILFSRFSLALLHSSALTVGRW